MNTLHTGDNLHIMREMEDESISLIIADPPFCTGRKFGAFDDQWKHNTTRAWEYGKICNESSSIPMACRVADTVHSDAMASYITFMTVRLMEMHRLLKDTGSIYIHCDPTASHYIKIAMDAVFTPKGYRNEIIWYYGLGGSTSRLYSKKHDTILFYTKSTDRFLGYYFKKPKIMATSHKMAGRLKGQPDVITDIPSLNNMAKERTGYPTQKPVALYERLISASCHPTGVVLDPFCGSGTTLVAANNLRRNSIGIDLNHEAISITQERLGDSKWKHM